MGHALNRSCDCAKLLPEDIQSYIMKSATSPCERGKSRLSGVFFVARVKGKNPLKDGQLYLRNEQTLSHDPENQLDGRDLILLTVFGNYNKDGPCAGMGCI
jgi:hypothetical protein